MNFWVDSKLSFWGPRLSMKWYIYCTESVLRNLRLTLSPLPGNLNTILHAFWSFSAGSYGRACAFFQASSSICLFLFSACLFSSSSFSYSSLSFLRRSCSALFWAYSTFIASSYSLRYCSLSKLSWFYLGLFLGGMFLGWPACLS